MATSTNTQTAIWPCLAFDDARAMIEFLTNAFGFEQVALYAREDDASVVEHGELRWPGGGGIMFGSTGRDDSPFGTRPAGAASLYLVTDEPDALHDRAKAAGATVIRGLRDEDYGSRGFSVADPEGNLWSFGTYRGE
ncbi:glyoxalase [Nocardia neocaledoniensis NBRC 108232]|uniref:Putative glyoxalase superfamily protein PhnB n=1 Tax=Nocardia neocaledoniensis TaxID=236511 RepID=A0A317NX49_9NOCA|nr:VOC family protein [Nocardia neocaledoniensis]PWV79552.1 putative glyoxalase superfamily protein PhnB [Nocardia neocaledoniensis]GEM30068.1 glyoxalase [Nocardia neocaledoniensis NBRC 108232]